MTIRSFQWALLSMSMLLGLVGVGRADPLSDAFARAGQNDTSLREFIRQAGEQHGMVGQRGAEFLVSYMPAADLESLGAEFLLENLSFAFQARAEFSWCAALPEEIFFNDVLPYASLDETRERWRPDLYEQAKGIVKGAATASEAVQALNRELFNLINVHYNTGRKRPNQSPSESIEQGRATCTGLSIILVDACRAVGIPARVTGTPLWTNNRGNHTWTEIWDGQWFFTGSDEFDAKGLNRGWFVGAAAKADKSDPKYSIYSSSWKKADYHFPMVWNRRNQAVNAFNVTDRYTGGLAGKANPHEVQLRVRDHQGGERIEVKAELIDEWDRIVSGVVTKAGRADMNDLAALSCRPQTTEWLRLTRNGESKRIPLRRTSTGTVTLDLAWDALPSDTEVGSSQLAGLKAWLAAPIAVRPPGIPRDVLQGGLSKEEAVEAQRLIWDDLVTREREARQVELDAKLITRGSHPLRFEEKTFGDVPVGGYSLWISLHGGGNAPDRVNDRQWRNQVELYDLNEGIYVAPRAPTNTWNLWHEGHIDPLFQRLIDDYVICRGVNPNRVYVLGYSAGGDGVYQLAPRMADRFAAAGMMAGHPNETKPTGLRNVGFALFMGGADGAYQRNEVAAKWRDQLASMRRADPTGYDHWVKIYPETGHWMDGRDQEALPWLAGFVRNPWPLRVEWLQDDVLHDRFYWLSVPAGSAEARQSITAVVDGQRISVTSDRARDRGLVLRLSDALVDLDEPISVVMNGQVVFAGGVQRSVEAIRQSLVDRADPASVATCLLPLD